MTGWETCQLCGIVGTVDQIGVRVAAWEDHHGPRPDKVTRGRLYDAIVRCRDSQECRDRYEVAGRRWPLTDTTKPTLPVAIKVVHQVEPVQLDDPDAPRAVKADEEEEEAAWLSR